ncbi:MAG: pseudouridine synthase [Pseudomonadota bacterium]
MKSSAGLPTRNGVGASCVALPPGSWPSIAEFLAVRFPAISRMQWLARMASGEVLDAAGTALSPDTPYRPHEKIFYYRSLPSEVRIPFNERILFQDDLIVAVDKPHFLPVTPSGSYLQETLLVRLKRTLGIDTLTPMHRLDRDTAGVVLFAVQPQTRDSYQALFRNGKIRKHYEALAPRRDHLQFPITHRSRLRESASFMQMEEVPGMPNAETTIELITLHGELAKYRLSPATGQKHQLRLHMSALGMPIVNDRIYPVLLPAPGPDAAPDYSQPLQLVARSIGFRDPITNAIRSFDSTYPLSM